MNSEHFVLEPHVWIMPPYRTCPACDAKEFGVLIIAPHHYVRRCRRCMADESFDLPSLEKRVLYLDQFAISNLMKAIHPDHRDRIRNRGAEEQQFWLDLFGRLDRLVKLNLLVCPSSLTHWEESLASRAYQDLRRMYEHLSAGVSFKDSAAIKRTQLIDCFRRWRDDAPTSAPLRIDDVTDGRLDGWIGRLQVQARMEPDTEEIDELLASREVRHNGLSAIVTRWRKEGRRSFDEYFEAELAGYGEAELQSYIRRTFEAAAMLEGNRPFVPQALSPTATQILILCLKQEIEESVNDGERLGVIWGFFQDVDHAEVPFLRISCAMLATLAVKASRHQARQPDRGLVADINTISTLMPYCDAMFIDNECRRLLTDAEMPMPGAATVFSRSNREELITWLEALEAGTATDHRELITEVYGDSWLEPFHTMYKAGPPAGPSAL